MSGQVGQGNREFNTAQVANPSDYQSSLLPYKRVLRTIWSLPEGATMDETLTPERVMEIGQEWKRILIQHTSINELDEMLLPEYKQHLIEQGIKQGIEQGVNKKIHNIVLAMDTKGFSPNVIADITGLTVEQVQILLGEEEATNTEE